MRAASALRGSSMEGSGPGFLLGLVQGLTEFLPVSSSGHLAVMEHILGRNVEGYLAFDVAVHAATLAAILVYFAKDLSRLVPSREPLDDEWYQEIAGGRGALYFYWLIVLAMVPLLVVYPLWGKYITALRREPIAIGVAFLYAGGFMTLAEALGRKSRGRKGLGWVDILLIGLAQAVALAPGISRSGMTISTGRMAGLSRDAAFRFSFIMVIPAILGAVVVELDNIAAFENWPALAAGAVGAFLSGMVALALLRRIVLRIGLWVFGLYCVLIGILTIIVRVYGIYA